jgi:prepilin-type N-terminal cleavage/methylation domain-containing protein
MANERGFSIVELLVAMAALGLLLGGVLALQQQGMNAYLFGAARAETQQNARFVLDRLSRELRTASAVTSAPNCNTGATDITFGFLDDAGVSVTVRYYVNGAELLRHQSVPAVGGQPEAMIRDVQALSIVCFDANGAATATVADISSVDVRLTTRVHH